ncbi:phosphatase PAP2 family protein [Acidovorax sp. BL-A-41-H1]|uniref:phosphatase PAP2 family protein n=1 Tax=Acidovorax sp. BL-A-41-H1 TaxID=3421102 RepID=UPI003F7A85C6
MSSDSFPAAGSAATLRTLLWWTLAGLAAAVAWDAGGGDLLLAQPFGTATGFPWRDHWFLVQVMHEDARRLGWLLVLLLTLAVWWPQGVLRRIDAMERLQMAVSALLALAVVSIAKNLSTTSCPWDLAQFGGVARHVSHWSMGVLDGGGGRCFPAGHASAGFAFLGGYFALRHKAPAAARWWLAGSLVAGLVLGAAQQMRGAHFMSHTLWTGWLCWTVGWLCDLAASALRARFPVFANTATPPEAPSPGR